MLDTSPFKKWSLIALPLNVDWELVTGFEQIICGITEDRWFLRLGLKKKKLLPGTHIILLSQIALGEASCHIMKTAKDPRKGSMWEGTQASRQQIASTCLRVSMPFQQHICQCQFSGQMTRTPADILIAASQGTLSQTACKSLVTETGRDHFLHNCRQTVQGLSRAALSCFVCHHLAQVPHLSFISFFFLYQSSPNPVSRGNAQNFCVLFGE